MQKKEVLKTPTVILKDISETELKKKQNHTPSYIAEIMPFSKLIPYAKITQIKAEAITIKEISEEKKKGLARIYKHDDYVGKAEVKITAKIKIPGTNIETTIVVEEKNYYFRSSNNYYAYNLTRAINDAEAHSSKSYRPLMNEMNHSPLQSTYELPIVAEAISELEAKANNFFEKQRKTIEEIIMEERERKRRLKTHVPEYKLPAMGVFQPA